MCWALFIKTIQTTPWNKIAMWKLLHIPGLLNSEKTKWKYQYKLSLNMYCLRRRGQWNRYNTNITTVLERSRSWGGGGLIKGLCVNEITNTTSIIRRFVNTTLFVYITADSKFKTLSSVTSSQPLFAQWEKSLCKYMVQLPHKILFVSK